MENSMPHVDFTKFDLSQLRQISRELNDEIEQKTEKEREKAAAEIKRIAGALGMTVEEILAGKKGKRGRKPKAKEDVSLSAPQPPIEDVEEKKKKPKLKTSPAKAKSKDSLGSHERKPE
jgi:hypothetical protein